MYILFVETQLGQGIRNRFDHGKRTAKKSLVGFQPYAKFPVQLLEQMLSGLRAENLTEATNIVSLVMDMRGFGPVKEEAVAKFRTEISDRLAKFSQITVKAA